MEEYKVANESCMVCFVSVGKLWKVSPCQHTICSECLMNHVKVETKSGKNSITCPHQDIQGICNKVLNWVETKNILLNSLKSELETLENRLSENKLNNDASIRSCPGCLVFLKSECPQTVPTKTRYVRCLNCAAFFCWNCLTILRSVGCKCSCYEDIIKNCDDIDLFGVRCPSIRACLKCGALIKYQEKCKHVTCNKCQQGFCFLCLKKLVGIRWSCSYDRPCTAAPRQVSEIKKTDTMFLGNKNENKSHCEIIVSNSFANACASVLHKSFDKNENKSHCNIVVSNPFAKASASVFPKSFDTQFGKLSINSPFPSGTNADKNKTTLFTLNSNPVSTTAKSFPVCFGDNIFKPPTLFSKTVLDSSSDFADKKFSFGCSKTPFLGFGKAIASSNLFNAQVISTATITTTTIAAAATTTTTTTATTTTTTSILGITSSTFNFISKQNLPVFTSVCTIATSYSTVPSFNFGSQPATVFNSFSKFSSAQRTKKIKSQTDKRANVVNEKIVSAKTNTSKHTSFACSPNFQSSSNSSISWVSINHGFASLLSRWKTDMKHPDPPGTIPSMTTCVRTFETKPAGNSVVVTATTDNNTTIISTATAFSFSNDTSTNTTSAATTSNASTGSLGLSVSLTPISFKFDESANSSHGSSALTNHVQSTNISTVTDSSNSIPILTPSTSDVIMSSTTSSPTSPEFFTPDEDIADEDQCNSEAEFAKLLKSMWTWKTDGSNCLT